MMELTDNFRAQMSAGDVQGAVASTQNREISGGGYHAGLGNKIAADRSKLQPDPSNTIANYHEREKEKMLHQAATMEAQQKLAEKYQADAKAREETELRLRCLTTCMKLRPSTIENSIKDAQKFHDFITGKRSLSEVPSGQ